VDLQVPLCSSVIRPVLAFIGNSNERSSGRRAVWSGKLRLDRQSLNASRGWRKPQRIFVNSMSDLFHEAVSPEFVGEVWSVMRETPQHTYQILTKRPDRMLEVTRGLAVLPNVWLGTSVESGDYLHRIDELRKVAAIVRFVSFEPLLGSVAACDLSQIHWAIVGGESGPRARPMSKVWVDEIEAACRKAGTAFFFKQWGGVRKKATGRQYRGTTFDEMPKALQV
jgi:protein gp37